VSSGALTWRVEEAFRKAWPGLRQAEVGDWLLRFAGGVSRRANSAHPRTARPGDFDAVVAAAETCFRAEGLPAIFRIPTFIARDADRRLEQLSYGVEGETAILHTDLEKARKALEPGVELRPRADAEWIAAIARLQGYGADKAATYGRVVGSITVPAAFAAMREDRRMAALAYGAIHDGMLCFESVITDAAYRGRGHARRVLASLMAWGVSRGAKAACLEVQGDNQPALALYRGLGLETELYRYHYRRAPRRGEPA